MSTKINRSKDQIENAIEALEDELQYLDDEKERALILSYKNVLEDSLGVVVSTSDIEYVTEWLAGSNNCPFHYDYFHY